MGANAGGLLDDVLGTGACLLLSGADLLPAVARHRDLLDKAGLPVVALGPEPGPETVVDTTGAYTGWLQDLSATAVLVRPDFAVYGTARTSAAVVDLLQGYCDGLTSEQAPLTVVDVRTVTAALSN